MLQDDSRMTKIRVLIWSRNVNKCTNDLGHFVLLSYSDAWRAVTDKVQDARANARLKQMSYSGVSGLSMFGLNHDAVVYLLEQLYGAANCRNYRFQFHQHELAELEEVRSLQSEVGGRDQRDNRRCWSVIGELITKNCKFDPKVCDVI